MPDGDALERAAIVWKQRYTYRGKKGRKKQDEGFAFDRQTPRKTVGID